MKHEIQLSPISETHVNDTYLGWLLDSEINQFLETRFETQSIESILSFVRTINLSEDNMLFAIEYNKKHVGNIKIGPINLNHMSADISYFVGDKSIWGKGVASKAVSLAVAYAFTQLKLRYLKAGAYSENIGSCKVLVKCGFSIGGQLKRALASDSSTSGDDDHVLFYLHRDDWIANNNNTI